MTNEVRDWIQSLPKVVQETAFRMPPDTCYREAGCYREDGSGHYRIYSYDEPEAHTDGVTLRVIHGADSFLPGFTVFGKAPGDLVPCDCGEWEPEQ